jgi:hypothetical protein
LIGPSGAVSPYKMVAAIYADLLDKNPGRLSIETLTPVESVTEVSTDGFPYKLQTKRGTIEAKNVVYCTWENIPFTRAYDSAGSGR